MPAFPSQSIQELARLLFEQEHGRPTETGPPSLLVEKLRVPLSKVFGQSGFRALLCRSLILARAKAPVLESLEVGIDGALPGLEDWVASVTADEVRSGDRVLTAQLLILLVTFIGPALTRSLLLEIWPHFDPVGL